MEQSPVVSLATASGILQLSKHPFDYLGLRRACGICHLPATHFYWTKDVLTLVDSKTVKRLRAWDAHVAKQDALCESLRPTGIELPTEGEFSSQYMSMPIFSCTITGLLYKGLHHDLDGNDFSRLPFRFYPCYKQAVHIQSSYFGQLRKRRFESCLVQTIKALLEEGKTMPFRNCYRRFQKLFTTNMRVAGLAAQRSKKGKLK